MKKVFDEESCEAILTSAARICWEMHESATGIIKAQVKRKKAFIRCSFSISRISLGDLILLRNNKRKDREQGFHLHGLVLIPFPKLHPKREVTTSKKRDVEILKVQFFATEIIRRREDCWYWQWHNWVYHGSRQWEPSVVYTGTSTPLDCNVITNWDSLPND